MRTDNLEIYKFQKQILKSKKKIETKFLDPYIYIYMCVIIMSITVKF